MSTSFLRTGQVGPATLSVREVRTGRTITTLTTDLVQDGRLVITSRLTLLSTQVGVEWSEPYWPDLPPAAACVRFEPPGNVSHFSRVDSAFDPSALPFTGDQAWVGGYVRPLEARPIDAAWLLMASDWFPPPAFSRLDPPTGGVSIDLTTHIHRTVPALDDVARRRVRDRAERGWACRRAREDHPDRRDHVAESSQTRLMTQR